jgi:hypothetical protein
MENMSVVEVEGRWVIAMNWGMEIILFAAYY